MATQPDIPPPIDPGTNPEPDFGPQIFPDDPGVTEMPPLPEDPAPDSPPAEFPPPDGPYIPEGPQPEARFVKPAYWTNEPAPAPAAPAPTDDPDGLSPTRYGDWTKNGIAVDF